MSEKLYHELSVVCEKCDTPISSELRILFADDGSFIVMGLCANGHPTSARCNILEVVRQTALLGSEGLPIC